MAKPPNKCLPDHGELHRNSLGHAFAHVTAYVEIHCVHAA